jgi:hypothetical protein
MATPVREAAGGLQRNRSRTGLSKTDTVNRALPLYELVDAELAGTPAPTV